MFSLSRRTVFHVLKANKTLLICKHFDFDAVLHFHMLFYVTNFHIRNNIDCSCLNVAMFFYLGVLRCQAHSVNSGHLCSTFIKADLRFVLLNVNHKAST